MRSSPISFKCWPISRTISRFVLSSWTRSTACRSWLLFVWWATPFDVPFVDCWWPFMSYVCEPLMFSSCISRKLKCRSAVTAWEVVLHNGGDDVGLASNCWWRSSNTDVLLERFRGGWSWPGGEDREALQPFTKSILRTRWRRDDNFRWHWRFPDVFFNPLRFQLKIAYDWIQRGEILIYCS